MLSHILREAAQAGDGATPDDDLIAAMQTWLFPVIDRLQQDFPMIEQLQGDEPGAPEDLASLHTTLQTCLGDTCASGLALATLEYLAKRSMEDLEQAAGSGRLDDFFVPREPDEDHQSLDELAELVRGILLDRALVYCDLASMVFRAQVGA